MTSRPTIIPSQSEKEDGLNKCPHCGSTEIFLVSGTSHLQCTYCQRMFYPPPAVPAEIPFQNTSSNLSQNTNAKVEHYSGAADIDPHASSLVTIKCQGCGTEVIINTNERVHVRCHWCRQILSLENQRDNGAVPDVLLPFHLSKERAQELIGEYVKKRKFFANPRFRKEFTTENVLGVYLPYFIIDANTDCHFSGSAGTLKPNLEGRRFAPYDLDTYNIVREFNLKISGLTVEACRDKREITNFEKTNNIINTIMPFDIENAIPYDGNYLKGFASERRDTNIDEVQALVNTQMKDIAREQAEQDSKRYNAGLSWENERVNTEGITWRSAYLPVWLYSYLEQRSTGKKVLHYVAVNARTGETVGSVPIHKARLFLVSFLIEVISFPIGVLLIMLALSCAFRFRLF